MAELVDNGIYYLSWTIVVTIILVILVILVIRQRQKHEADMQEMNARFYRKNSQNPLRWVEAA